MWEIRLVIAQVCNTYVSFALIIQKLVLVCPIFIQVLNCMEIGWNTQIWRRKEIRFFSVKFKKLKNFWLLLCYHLIVVITDITSCIDMQMPNHWINHTPIKRSRLPLTVRDLKCPKDTLKPLFTVHPFICGYSEPSTVKLITQTTYSIHRWQALIRISPIP